MAAYVVGVADVDYGDKGGGGFRCGCGGGGCSGIWFGVGAGGIGGIGRSGGVGEECGAEIFARYVFQVCEVEGGHFGGGWFGGLVCVEFVGVHALGEGYEVSYSRREKERTVEHVQYRRLDVVLSEMWLGVCE